MTHKVHKAAVKKAKKSTEQTCIMVFNVIGQLPRQPSIGSIENVVPSELSSIHPLLGQNNYRWTQKLVNMSFYAVEWNENREKRKR